VLETAKYLSEKCGYDVTLICSDIEKIQHLIPDNIKTISVKMSRGVNFSGFKSIKEFKKIFEREKFDMVQYATPNASFYASVASKKAKIPVRLYCQWGIRYVGFSGIKRRIFKFLEKKVCKNSTNVFAVSPKNMAFAIKEKLYPKNKAKVIGNGGTIGVDLKVYDLNLKERWREEIRSKYQIKDSDFVYGFVGRLSKDKGAKELISAFHSINAKENAKLLIVGPLESAELDEETLTLLKSNKNVISTGLIDNAEIKKYYSALDVLVHPTYREGFGMVLQEAGALKVPAITTNVPGASEVMVNNQSCVLVEPKDVLSLEKAMLKLLNDKELIARLGESAFERTKELYSRNVMLENQRIAYEELLGE
jgi:glycosyltransferase involved in cell wall biosynthesis